MTGSTRRRRADPSRADEVCRTKIGYLSAMELFGDLPGEELLEVERAATMRTCRAGQVCYTPGVTGEMLFILKKGSIRLYRVSPEGRKLVIAELKPYSFFGEMMLLGQSMYDTFAEASRDAIFCTMTRADVKRLILPRPQVVVRILQGVGRRMIEVERALEEATFKGLVPRVAALLLRESAGGDAVELTHQEIADRLGVYRESATVALNELKGAGLVETARRRVSIVDRAALERMGEAFAPSRA